LKIDIETPTNPNMTRSIAVHLTLLDLFLTSSLAFLSTYSAFFTSSLADDEGADLISLAIF